MTFSEDLCGLELGNSRILSSLSLRQGLGSAVTSLLARLLLSSDLHRFLFGLLLSIVPFHFFWLQGYLHIQGKFLVRMDQEWITLKFT